MVEQPLVVARSTLMVGKPWSLRSDIGAASPFSVPKPIGAQFSEVRLLALSRHATSAFSGIR
jgi:hypothetical protein